MTTPQKKTAFQRDSVDSETEWQERLSELTSGVDSAEATSELARAKGRLGDHLRLRAETNTEAIAILHDAVELAESLEEDVLLVSNTIRLATAYQYAGEHERARPFFEHAIQLAERHDHRTLLGFAHQHYGKCLAETGDLAPARRHLTRALRIRTSSADETLIESTQRALNALDALSE